MAHGVYRTGLASRLFRLDDPAGAWIDISLDTHGLPHVGSQVVMSDVQTIPGQDDSVFMCGSRSQGVELQPDFYGIAFSHDAGNTWVEPNGGDYQNISFAEGHFFLKVWVVDPNTIYVTCSNGKVYKSVDGGLTFYETSAIPPYVYNWTFDEQTQTYTGNVERPIVNSLHFRNPIFGVVGMINAVAITTNGGSNWTIKNIDPNVSPSPLPGLMRGVHISANGQTILAAGTNSIMKSYDSGATWQLVWSWDAHKAQGWHLARYGDTDFVAFASNGMIIKSSDGGGTWTIIPGREYNQDGPRHNAGDLYAVDHGYFNSWYEDVDNDRVDRTIDGFLVPTVNTWSVESLAGYSPEFTTLALWTREVSDEDCFKLTNCEDPEQAIYITAAGIADYDGQVVWLCPEDFEGQEYPFSECICFLIEQIECDQVGPLLTISGDVIINNIHPDCIVCLGNCFKLVDCEDPNHIIYTNEDYSGFVGSVITLSYPSHATGLCWEVFEDDCSHGYEQTKMIEEVGTCCACESTRPECQCYELARCGWHGPAILVHPENNWLEPYIGMVIQHPDLLGGYCYEISVAESCENSVDLAENPDVNSYNNCLCCTDTIYVFQDCRNEGWDPQSGDPMPGLPDIYSTLDCLTEQQLGQITDAIENGEVIEFGGNGVCWIPAVAVDCPEPEEVDDVIPEFETHADCETCLAVPPPVIQQNVRSIKPGYDTPGCDPAYTEKINCTFANAMYNKMSVDRYGVKMCCDLDIDKWAIKKELLELKAIYNAEMCDTAVETPSCPPDPDIEYPTPTPVT